MPFSIPIKDIHIETEGNQLTFKLILKKKMDELTNFIVSNSSNKIMFNGQ